MAKINITIEEEDQALIECLLYIKSELTTPRADIILHKVDGEFIDMEVQKRHRIKDLHKKIRIH